MKIWNNLFLSQNFFFLAAVFIIVFILSFIFPSIFLFAKVVLGFFFAISVIDLLLLMIPQNAIQAKRIVKSKLSISDENSVKIHLENHYSYRVSVEIIEELPTQFQIRNLRFSTRLLAKKSKTIEYTLRAIERGEYEFRNTNVFVKSPFRIFLYRYVLNTKQNIKVYPAFLALKKFDLLSVKVNKQNYGNHKMRKIGKSMEFEQIKNYVRGDDIRTINWKATAKHQNFMVNQYVDEKSQAIYSVIDKGRVMKMPFHGLSLLDYAINSSLVISNVAVQNQDRAGMFSFSHRIDDFLKAEKYQHQMRKILERLYHIKTDYKESDFGKLYHMLKTKLNQRSLIFLYTNFENMNSLHRQLQYIKAINRTHVLVPIFFLDSELEEYTRKKTQNDQESYSKAIAEKFLYEKQLMKKELEKHGIRSILTKPEDLNITVVNQYLEIKSKAII